MAAEFKKVNVQSLECPVCQDIFTDPKILPCSHTCCKICLERLVECNQGWSRLKCPVCRSEIQVSKQDIARLTTNLALKSLIDDVNKPRNEQRKYRSCHKHPKQDEEYFCDDCKLFECAMCFIMEHNGHSVTEASVYERNHIKNIEDLKSKAEKKQESIHDYVELVNEEKRHAKNTAKRCISDISKAYEESVQQLKRKKDLLIDEVKRRDETVEKELDRFKELAQDQITHISDLVSKGTKIPFDKDALTAHDTWCNTFQDALRQEVPDYKQPQKSSEGGMYVTFKRKVKTDELNLGMIVNYQVKSIELPVKDSMDAMVPMPDGRMAVGCNPGGINIFSADGELQQTVLEDVEVYDLGFLSDGRCVVLDPRHKITLYTPDFNEKLDVKFETESEGEDNLPILAVNNYDKIHVGCWNSHKIQVFASEGGKAIKEIQCNGYTPQQISCYKDLLIIVSDGTLLITDGDGIIEHQVGKPNVSPYATVTQNKAIMIHVAWVNHDEGLVTIEECNNELVAINTIIADYKFEKPERHWYCLREFQSGEIGFCTSDRLYIFYLPE